MRSFVVISIIQTMYRGGFKVHLCRRAKIVLSLVFPEDNYCFALYAVV